MDIDGDPLIGTTLDGRYSILECIGEGGMGRVYRAVHTRMSRKYAVKVLFGDLAGDKRMRSRFSREAEAVSRLEHPNVISVVDFGETKTGLLYLVMDLAEGQPLSEVIEEQAPMPENEIAKILAKLCQGLGHAHARGLIHRDFKGENVILVKEEGEWVPKILDFGICMMVEQSPDATMLTNDGIVIGTPAMMSPEQATGDIVDHRSDQFSLGIVLYQMLTGEMPFEGSPIDMARQNLYAKMPSVKEKTGIECKSNLEEIAFKLAAKKPEDRYDQVRDVIKAINTDSGADISYQTLPPLERVPSVRRNDNTEGSQVFHTESTEILENTSALPFFGNRKNLYMAVAGAATLFVMLLFFGFRSSKAETEDQEKGSNASIIAAEETTSTSHTKTDSALAGNHLENEAKTDTLVADTKQAEKQIEATDPPEKEELMEIDTPIEFQRQPKTARTTKKQKRKIAKTKATKKNQPTTKKDIPRTVTNTDVTKACTRASQLIKQLNKKKPSDAQALKAKFRNIDMTSAFSNPKARPVIKRRCDQVAQTARRKL